MTRFEEWWEGTENPARNLPESTQIQVKPYMRAAFNGGIYMEKKRREEKDRITNDAILEARNMFREKPL